VKNHQYSAIIEALLFAWGDPLEIKEIAKILALNEKTTSQIIAELQEEYVLDNRGLELVKIGSKIQLTTKQSVHPYIKKLLPKDQRRSLSRATIETLAIIVYKQPITKNQIEKIRGVKCDKPLTNLIQENLIYEKERLNTIGRPIIYATTEFFLKKFGFENIKDLPELKNFEEELIKLKETSLNKS
jgi:segregation and condensation protein B